MKYAKYKTELITRDFLELCAPTGNIYEAVAIIGKRARQVAMRTKEELDNKLADFIADTDNQQEESEKTYNQEQIDLSRFYERMPKPATVATEEFLKNKLMYRYPEAEDLRTT